MNESRKGGGTREATEQKQVMLVIDGTAMPQFCTSIYLQRLGYHMLMARTEEDAMLFLELAVPLMVITNDDLPAMRGAELLQHVKQAKRIRSVPVIIYTTNRDPTVPQTGAAAGCAAFLRHPCILDDLYTTVWRATGDPPRRFLRLNTRLEVVINDVEDDRMGFISDPCGHGMFASSTALLPYGSIHAFAFPLLSAPGRVLRVKEQIRHMHPRPGRRKSPGMGVQFTRTGDQEWKRVKDFIVQVNEVRHRAGLIQG